MNVDGQQGKWTFGLRWIVLNTAGWSLFILLGFAASWLVWELWERGGVRLLSNEEVRFLVSVTLTAAGWGVIVGWIQRSVLALRLDLEGKRWVWATVAGLTLYILLIALTDWLASALSSSLASFYALYAITALVPPCALGIAQWLVLRDRVERSGWWIAATVIALWLPAVLLAVLPAGTIGGGVGFVLSYPLGGLLYGMLTLLVLHAGAQEASAE